MMASIYKSKVMYDNILHAKRTANDQSVIIKVEYGQESVMLAGDASFLPWKEDILNYYGDDLKSSILLAPHHGSLTFFDDPSDDDNYYVSHLSKIAPSMTIISVGPSSSDLPDDKAVELYKKYSSGSNQGNKVYTTKDKGTIKLTLEQNKWAIKTNQ